MYNEGKESLDHLFYTCAYVKNIWHNITAWLNVSCTTSNLYKWAENILTQDIRRKRKEITSVLFIETIYHKWKARNELKYQGKPTGWKFVAYIIKEHIRQRVLYLANHSQRYRKYIDLVLTH